MQVRKQKFESWQEALTFAQQKLSEGYGNIRIIAVNSKLAKRYGIVDTQVQVRWWGLSEVARDQRENAGRTSDLHNL